MRGALSSLAGVFLISFIFSPIFTSCSLRGVHPALVSLYTPQLGKFKCLDGSRAIDFKHVNDDFCDCSDGSDEPGDHVLLFLAAFLLFYQ